jgi:hypothetical protein
VLAHAMGVWVVLSHALVFRPRSIGWSWRADHPSLRGWCIRDGQSPGADAPGETVLRALAYQVVWSWQPSSPGARRALVKMSRTTQEARQVFRKQIVGRPIVENDHGSFLLEQIMRIDLRDRLREVSARALVLLGARTRWGLLEARGDAFGVVRALLKGA